MAAVRAWKAKRCYSGFIDGRLSAKVLDPVRPPGAAAKNFRFCDLCHMGSAPRTLYPRLRPGAVPRSELIPLSRPGRTWHGREPFASSSHCDPIGEPTLGCGMAHTKTLPHGHRSGPRSEARRVGKECVTTCRSGCTPYH